MSCQTLLTVCLLSLGYLCELPGLPVELGELLGEVRSLRAQLQNSVHENSALKQLELHKQLEQKLGVGSPRTPSLSALTASPQRENFYRRQLLHGKRQTLLLLSLHTVHTWCKTLRNGVVCCVSKLGLCICVLHRPSSVSTCQGHWSV